VAESKGIESDLIPKIATGFCAGMSRTCGMCGAVSGAVMAIDLFYGRNKPDEPVAESFTKVKKLMDMFETEFGATNCQQLTGCNLGTEEGQKAFASKNLVEKCIHYTQEATRMAISIIEEGS